MIKLLQLSKYYGSLHAVKHIDLHIAHQQIFGLVGPDGAGKTTLLRMLAGLLMPDAGSLTVLGTTQIEQVKPKIGYVPQQFSLYEDLTVGENLRLMGALYGCSEQQIKTKSQHVLAFTGLLPFIDRYAANLSGGMKQKLALAASLLHQPQLIILDEPTTGVDPVSRREFWQMLYSLNKSGASICIATPYMDEAELCHQIAFMHHGNITACDSPQALRACYPYRLFAFTTPGRRLGAQLNQPPVISCHTLGHTCFLATAKTTDRETIAEFLCHQHVVYQNLSEVPPTLDDVFIALATEAGLS